MKKSLILLGGGGHCKSVIDIIESDGSYNIIGILDEATRVGEYVLSYEIIGSDDDIEYWVNQNVLFLITVGQIKSSDLRVKLFNKVINARGHFATVVAKSAIVSKSAKIEAGTVVMHNAFINAEVEISCNCIINTGAIIEHETKIGKHCHVSTGATINGQVVVKDNCFIGSNAVLINNITIEKGTVVGSGSNIIGDIPHENVVFIGNPGRMKKI